MTRSLICGDRYVLLTLLIAFLAVIGVFDLPVQFIFGPAGMASGMSYASGALIGAAMLGFWKVFCMVGLVTAGVVTGAQILTGY